MLKEKDTVLHWLIIIHHRVLERLVRIEQIENDLHMAINI